MNFTRVKISRLITNGLTVLLVQCPSTQYFEQFLWCSLTCMKAKVVISPLIMTQMNKLVAPSRHHARWPKYRHWQHFNDVCTRRQETSFLNHLQNIFTLLQYIVVKLLLTRRTVYVQFNKSIFKHELVIRQITNKGSLAVCRIKLQVKNCCKYSS